MLRVQEIGLGKLNLWEGNPRLNDHAVDAVVEPAFLNLLEAQAQRLLLLRRHPGGPA